MMDYDKIFKDVQELPVMSDEIFEKLSECVDNRVYKEDYSLKDFKIDYGQIFKSTYYLKPSPSYTISKDSLLIFFLESIKIIKYIVNKSRHDYQPYLVYELVDKLKIYINLNYNDDYNAKKMFIDNVELTDKIDMMILDILNNNIDIMKSPATREYLFDGYEIFKYYYKRCRILYETTENATYYRLSLVLQQLITKYKNVIKSIMHI